MIDVVALGELLIDFCEQEQGSWVMKANPGGAPCNVLSMLNNLGHKTAFIGKVGHDMFGSMLKETLDGLHIDTEGLVFSSEYNTTLAFVHNNQEGDRDFSFYRQYGADAFLTKEEVNLNLIKDARIFHYGTLSMTNSTVFEATAYALDYAKSNKILLSFDPNLRPPLWKKEEDARDKIWYGISKCDILKIGDEELKFITGSDIEEGVSKIRDKYDIPLITVTRGKEGSVAFYKDLEPIYCPTFTNVKTIDTTGAGDTFCASMLHYVLKTDYNFTKESLEEALKFSNASSSIITTRRGALSVMPTLSEIENLLKS